MCEDFRALFGQIETAIEEVESSDLATTPRDDRFKGPHDLVLSAECEVSRAGGRTRHAGRTALGHCLLFPQKLAAIVGRRRVAVKAPALVV